MPRRASSTDVNGDAEQSDDVIAEGACANQSLSTETKALFRRVWYKKLQEDV